MNTESKLHRLLHRRFTLKRRRSIAEGERRNNLGFSLIQLIVALVIVGVLSAIAGPALWDQIFSAREQALQTNIRSAAEVLQTSLTTNPDLKTTAGGNGAPSEDAITYFNANLGVEWNSDWVLTDTDGPDVVRVQFLTQGTPAVPSRGGTCSTSTHTTETACQGAGATWTPAATVSAPVVDWLAGNGGAVRVHGRNSDGAWACALVVLQPAISPTDTPWFTATEGSAATASSGTNTIGGTSDLASSNERAVANLRGVWFDSGSAADAGADNCSPVDTQATARATAPHSATEWIITNGRVLGRNF